MLHAVTEDTINVGLMARDNTTKQHLGRTNCSFGYYKGDLLLNKRKVKMITIKVASITPSEKLNVRDRLGMGVNNFKRTLFVTKNGQIVAADIAIPAHWNDYYPAVGVSQDAQKVKLFFNPKEFKFDLMAMIKEVEH